MPLASSVFFIISSREHTVCRPQRLTKECQRSVANPTQKKEKQVENTNEYGNHFFETLAWWQSELQRSEGSITEAIKVARAKPAGATHNPNLYMAVDGTIWDRFGCMWCEVQRSSDSPYAPYDRTLNQFEWGKEKIVNSSVQSVGRPDGTKLTFLKRSWLEHMPEDWGWEVKNPGSGPPSFSTLEYLEDNLRRDQNGLRLANILFEKRKQIEEWMKAYAEGQGTLRETHPSVSHHDWNILMDRFAPEIKCLDLTDTDPLRYALPRVLDEIACGRQVRGYAF